MKRLIYALLIGFLLSGCHVGRFVYYNFADLNDYKKFPSRPIANAGEAFTFHQPTDQKSGSALIPTLTVNGEKQDFETALGKNKTVAFMVIRNDTMLYENYWKGYDTAAVIPSFSMAKSYVSAMIGIAVGEGKIQSVDQPVTDYITEWKGTDFDRITIKNALNMASGVKYIENYYNPFGNVAVGYYGTNLYKHVEKLTITDQQGQFDYKSIDTQILAMVLERATGVKPATYLEEKIWTKIGMEYDASWSLDSKRNDTEKAFCCINARARDFAKFGRLYLNGGKWNGEQIVPADWVATSTEGSQYRYQWWRTTDGYMAQGFLGQYIIVYPDKNIIVVRMGKNYGDLPWTALAHSIYEKL